MKFTFSFATLLVVLPVLASQVAALAVPAGDIAARASKGGNKGKGKATSTSASSAAAATASSDPAAGLKSTATPNNKDPQNSLTLIKSVIATGFLNNGQSVAEAGQVASLTSGNNFINFCATVPNLPITNGKQITSGSCNPAPMGMIPASTKMPSAKFKFPENGGTIAANTPFTISLAISNLETGNFVNAQQNYFSAPQQLNKQGVIVGHSHVVVEKLSSLKQTTPTDPTKFAFFKGLNSVAAGGVLTADVAAGLPAGVYKVSSINAAANHQPVLGPIAQHGSFDDVVYFTVSGNGAKPPTATGTANDSKVTTTTTANPAAASTTKASRKGKGKGMGKGKRFERESS